MLLQNLVHQAVLDVDAPRTCSLQIAHQPFKTGWGLKGILSEDFQQLFNPAPQPHGPDLPGIPLSLSSEDNCPTHHFSSVAQSDTGVAMPSRIDSRIPGTDSR